MWLRTHYDYKSWLMLYTILEGFYHQRPYYSDSSQWSVTPQTRSVCMLWLYTLLLPTFLFRDGKEWHLIGLVTHTGPLLQIVKSSAVYKYFVHTTIGNYLKQIFIVLYTYCIFSMCFSLFGICQFAMHHILHYQLKDWWRWTEGLAICYPKLKHQHCDKECVYSVTTIAQ